ncbi:MAG: GIY-YIG nuclease family protein [Hymenobacteraceae bacterium]|nr:GIY-YIG nuclease family protein [Hymenobacteraceae bacterium]
MNYSVYILYSESRDRYYIGSTENAEKRLEQHNTCRSNSTKGGIPWKLLYQKLFVTRSEAVQFENWIKKQKSRKVIEELISSAG